MVLLRRLLMVALFVAALAGGWTFASENGSLVPISYGFGTLLEVPLWVALVGSFGIGAGLCLLAVAGRLTRSSLAQRRYRKTVAALEAEVHQLRNLPIEGESPAPAVEAVASVPGGADGAEPSA